MAKDIKLDDYGDLDLTTGDFVHLEENDELAQLVKTKLLKVFDEDLAALETGIDWFKKMYDFQKDDKFRALIIKAAVLQIPEITGIPSLDVVSDSADGETSVTLEIESIYSDEPIQVGG